MRAFANQRRERWVGAVASVPVVLALDGDRRKGERKAGRGEQRLERKIGVAEKTGGSTAHGGRGDEEPRCLLAAQRREVDMRLEHCAKLALRLRTRRAGRGRGEVAGVHEARPGHGGRGPARHRLHDRQHRRGPSRCPVDVLPERPERLLGPAAPAGDEPRGRHGGVHCPRARTRERGDGEARLFQQPIEHAPSEGAMRTAALQGDIEMDRVVAGHIARPISGGKPRRAPDHTLPPPLLPITLACPAGAATSRGGITPLSRRIVEVSRSGSRGGSHGRRDGLAAKRAVDGPLPAEDGTWRPPW